MELFQGWWCGKGVKTGGAGPVASGGQLGSCWKAAAPGVLLAGEQAVLDGLRVGEAHTGSRRGPQVGLDMPRNGRGRRQAPRA